MADANHAGFALVVDLDTPAIKDAQRPACEAWLQEIDFLAPGGQDEAVWKEIKRYWAAFITATRRPGGVHNRRAVQRAVWGWMDEREGLSERWPEEARRRLNCAADGPGAGPFESLAPKWQLERRRRQQTVWTSLVCFLEWAYHEGALGRMGLDLPAADMTSRRSEQAKEKDEHGNLLVELVEALVFAGDRAQVEACIGSLLSDTLARDTVRKPRRYMAQTNILIWWTAVLVRSAVAKANEPDDYISRGGFPSNILAVDVDIQGRVEALRHSCKVIAVDVAMAGLVAAARNSRPQSLDRQRVVELGAALDMVDNSWIDGDGPNRRAASGVQADMESGLWETVLGVVEASWRKQLGGLEGTAMCEINRLWRMIYDPTVPIAT